MGRGKNKIEKIEDGTKKQVTFSKRRKGLFKKVDELSILCDAKVSLIIISSSHKLSEYTSNSITTKEIFDRYQQTQGIDLWSNKYEKMQEELRRQEEKNNRLRREIRQRMGEDLSGLNFHELHHLEQEMDASFRVTHEQLIKKISTRTNTLKKKQNNSGGYYPSPRGNHLGDVEPQLEDAYGMVDNGGQYESAVASAPSSLYAFRMHHVHHPSLYYAPVVGPHQLRFV